MHLWYLSPESQREASYGAMEEHEDLKAMRVRQVCANVCPARKLRGNRLGILCSPFSLPLLCTSSLMMRSRQSSCLRVQAMPADTHPFCRDIDDHDDIV
jgi:hypothetical protein